MFDNEEIKTAIRITIVILQLYCKKKKKIFFFFNI